MSNPFENTRGPSALAQPPRPVDDRRRFQLTEPLMPAQTAEANPVYWNGQYWVADTETTFEVKDTLGKFWGAKHDRGFARPAHHTYNGPFWEVCENPGRPWYWASLDEDLPYTSTAAATLRNGSGAGDENLGAIEQLWAPLLSSGQLDAGSMVRVSMDLSVPRWVAVGAPC